MSIGTLTIPIQGCWEYHATGEYGRGNLFIGSSVYLIPEPNNIHDPNAIEVRLSRNNSKLGYIPRTQAKWIRVHLNAGESYSASVVYANKVKNYSGKQLIVSIVLQANWINKPQEADIDFSVVLKRSGVYRIFNCENGKNYIGKSCDISRRWKEHLKTLNSCSHENYELQKDWNQYLAGSFKFSVLEYESDASKLGKLEEKFIEKYDAYKSGYNGTSDGKWRPVTKRRRQRLNPSLSDIHLNDIRQWSSSELAITRSGVPKKLIALFVLLLALSILYLSC